MWGRWMSLFSQLILREKLSPAPGSLVPGARSRGHFLVYFIIEKASVRVNLTQATAIGSLSPIFPSYSGRAGVTKGVVLKNRFSHPQ